MTPRTPAQAYADLLIICGIVLTFPVGFFLALGFTFPWLGSLPQQISSARWQPVQAHAPYGGLSRQQCGVGADLKLNYQYTWENVTHEANAVLPGGLGGPFRLMCHLEVEQLVRRDGTLTAYVNPDQPDQATLQRGVQVGYGLPLGLLAFLGPALVVTGVRMGAREERRERAEPLKKGTWPSPTPPALFVGGMFLLIVLSPFLLPSKVVAEDVASRDCLRLTSEQLGRPLGKTARSTAIRTQGPWRGTVTARGAVVRVGHPEDPLAPPLVSVRCGVEKGRVVIEEIRHGQEITPDE